MMKLKKLLKDIPSYQVKGSKEVIITGVSANSKLLMPGYLFIAKRGKSYDGADYVHEAISSGAAAIVTDLFDPSLKDVVQVIHPDVAAIESLLAATYYQQPSQELLMVGITGTNGKTTTSFLIKNLLDNFYGPCGLIGTIECIIGPYRYQANCTTPDVTTNQKMLREMIRQGCKSAVMEVSSHALDQGRVDQIDFDVALFSNLTNDHLDYHGTIEKYGLAKSRLFSQLGQVKTKKKRAKWAVINQDSPWAPKIVEHCSAAILTYGIEQAADLQITQLALQQNGTHAQITYQGQTLPCYWPLIGRFNAYNCLAAMAVGLTQQIPLEHLIEKMRHLPAVRGRLEPVSNELGLKIYVDFAHSGDALVNVLQTLKEIQPSGRLIVVFGCGGDRDRTKRAEMAQACEKYADFCLVTSDNPRSEDPYQICAEITKSFSPATCYQVEVDRQLAIKKAIALTQLDDILLIAGKGHETYQTFAHKTIEFNDVAIAAQICTDFACHKLKSV